MSSRAPAWFEQKYVAGAIHKLQSKGWLLKEAVNSTGEIKGNQVSWKIAGAGVATEMADGISDVPVMNADRSLITATMKDYEANDWIKTTDIEKMSENEQQVSQQTAAMAMGRKFDSVLLGTLDADASIQTIGDGTAAISILDVMTAQNAIADVGVGSYDYFCTLPTALMSQLEVYREFSNSQYVGDEFPLLKQVGARRWRGVTFIPVPSAYLNVPAANKIDAYLWVKDFVGLVPNYAMQSRIDYVATKKAYLAANTMGMASASLMPEGVKRLRFASNVALTRPTP